MSEKNIVISWIKAEILSVLITIAAMVICAAVITYTDAGEDCINIVSPAVTAVCAFLSAVMVSAKMKQRGILWGIAAGIFYIVCIWIMIFLGGRESFFGEKSLMFAFISIFFGASGGIFGINIKK